VTQELLRQDDVPGVAVQVVTAEQYPAPSVVYAFRSSRIATAVPELASYLRIEERELEAETTEDVHGYSGHAGLVWLSVD
jgi:hypothetical protein